MKTERKQFMKITQKEFMQAVEALAEKKAAEKLQMMIGKHILRANPGHQILILAALMREVSLHINY